MTPEMLLSTQFALGQRANVDVDANNSLCECHLVGLLLRVRVELRLECTADQDGNFCLELPAGSLLMQFATCIDSRWHVGSWDERAPTDTSIGLEKVPLRLENGLGGHILGTLGHLAAGSAIVVRYEYIELLDWADEMLLLAIPTALWSCAAGGAQRARVAMLLEGVSGQVSTNVPGAALAIDSTGFASCVDIPATAQDIDSHRCRTIIGIASADAASICIAAHAQSRTHALLSVRVPPIAPAPATLALKIVLDMSQAVHIGAYFSYVTEILSALKGLRADDQFSITLLRDDPSQPLAKMRRATDRALADAEAILLHQPRAEELPSSLDDVFIEALDIASAADHVSVVLITATPFLDRERVMYEAVDAEESVFPVVCGHRPNVSFMRKLAEATGGACEWALGTLGLHRELNRQLLRATGARQRHFAATCPTVVQELRGHPPCEADSLPWTFAGETLHKFLTMNGDVGGEVQVAHPQAGMSEPLIKIDPSRPLQPEDLWTAPVPSLVEQTPIWKAQMPDFPAIAEAWLALRSLDDDGHALFKRSPLCHRTEWPPLTPVLSASDSGG